jgi:hypothetical protein
MALTLYRPEGLDTSGEWTLEWGCRLVAGFQGLVMLRRGQLCGLPPKDTREDKP